MKGIIALKYLETPQPLDLVSKIIEHNKETFGYCFVDADGLNPTGDRGYPDPEGLVKSQDQAKMQTVYLFGAEAPALDEDHQPWEMLRNSKNEIVAVGFFEGDFSGMKKVDSAHVPAYHAKETLARKLKMMLRAVKDDADQLYEECKSDEFKAEIEELFTTDGTVVLQFKNDHVLWFCNPLTRKITNKFGIFSDLAGWVEPKEVETTEGKITVEPLSNKKKGNDKLAALMAASKSPTSNSGVPKANPANPPASVPTVVPPAVSQGTPTTYEDILKTKTLRILSEEKVAGMLKGGGKFRHVENWYNDVGGGGWPADWDKSSMMDLWNEITSAFKRGGDSWKELAKDLPGIIGKKDKVDARKEYEALKAKGLATDVGDKTTVINKVETQGKDDVTKKITSIEGTGDTEFLPILSEGSVVHLQKFVEKYWDKNHQPLDRDPTKLKTFEDKFPSFLEKAGLKEWADLDKLPLEAYQDICRKHDLARLLMFGLVTENERLRKTRTAVQQTSQMTAANLPGARKRA